MKKRFIWMAFLSLTVFFCSACYSKPTGETESKPSAQQNTEQNTQALELGFVDSPQRIEQAAQSVLKITSYEDDGDVLVTGSGVVLFESNLVVTNCHVIVNMAYLELLDEAGNSYRLEQKDVLVANQDYDIAICRIPQETKLTPLPYSTEETARGEKVLTIGSQYGVLNMVTTGVVSGHWESGGQETILFTAPVSAGASGGAVFNNHGEVIGIVMGTYNSSQNLNIAVPVVEAEKLYQSYIKE